MDDKLVPYLRGEVRAPSQDRALMRRAKPIYDDVRLSGLMVDGAFALGAHIMEGATSLDDRRRLLAGNDPGLNTILARIEATTLQQVEELQSRLLDDYGL
jgi:hypothetical protein